MHAAEGYCKCEADGEGRILTEGSKSSSAQRSIHFNVLQVLYKGAEEAGKHIRTGFMLALRVYNRLKLCMMNLT